MTCPAHYLEPSGHSRKDYGISRKKSIPGTVFVKRRFGVLSGYVSGERHLFFKFNLSFASVFIIGSGGKYCLSRSRSSIVRYIQGTDSEGSKRVGPILLAAANL